MSNIKNIDELELNNKRVLIRLDFNVPLKEENGETIVADDTRIREALPTIQYAVNKNAKVILMSHLGRPKGADPKFSLEPIAKHLSLLLNTEITMTDECVGEGIELMIRQMKSGQIILLENLRFYSEEENNDPDFAHALAGLCDVFINDAFGTAHRKHASTYGVPQLVQTRGCGYLLKKEIQFLSQLLENPQHPPKHPYVVVLGGSKVRDKIKTIENLYLSADTVLIGGAMAHIFRLAKGGYELPKGAKEPKSEEIELAKMLIAKAKKQDVQLILPTDDIDGFDIGPETILKFKTELSSAKTIFWNGPVGMFENPKYAKGTFEIAHTIAENSTALKVVGGGDSVAAVAQAGLSDQFSHISTGGGASLEFLEGNSLPGIDVLKNYEKRVQIQYNMDSN